MTRRGRRHRSHELMRYCAQRELAVVGGISKLIKAFSREHQPDDIVTVVDRDFGDGVGWQTMGFAPVQRMPPLIFMVDQDCRRHHVIGTGGGGRIMLPDDVLAAAAAAAAAAGGGEGEGDAAAAEVRVLDALAAKGYYGVFDAGMQRFMVLLNNEDEGEDEDDALARAQKAWEDSAPSYSPDYYTSHPGLGCLLSPQ